MKRLSTIAFLIAFHLTLTIAAEANASSAIAVLLTSEEPAFCDVAASFAKHVKHPVHYFNLEGEFSNAAIIMPKLLASEPRIILALGAKAAVAAKKWTRDKQHIPVLFAMVIDWKMFDLLDGQSNIMGIDAEISPAGYLTNMTMFRPSVRTIGVIHGEGFNNTILRQARHDAEQLGLELIVATISRSKDFIFTFKGMEDRIDGYWQILDPTVSTPDNISWLQQRCIKDRIVCLGSSENMSAAGILFGMGQSSTEIGAEAAAIAKKIIEDHQEPARYGVVNPMQTSFSVNLRTANAMDLSVDTSTISRYNELSLWLWPVDKTFSGKTTTTQ